MTKPPLPPGQHRRHDLARFPMPPRTARLGRTAGVRRRNPERQRENHERAYGGEARIQFVKSLPCANCGRRAAPSLGLTISNAHTRNGGKSRKGHYSTIVPLCESLIRDYGCHNRQHDEGWSVLRNLDSREKRAAAAAATEKAWVAHVAAHSGEDGEQ